MSAPSLVEILDPLAIWIETADRVVIVSEEGDYLHLRMIRIDPREHGGRFARREHYQRTFQRALTQQLARPER